MIGVQISTRVRGLVVTALALALVATPAAAQNLVTNGTFDHDVSGWTTSNPDVAFLFRSDAGNTLSGGSGPGSMEVQYSIWGGGSGPVQEIQVTAGTTYTCSGTAFLPDSTDNMADGADFLVQWLDGDGFRIGSDWLGLWPIEKGRWLSVSTDLVAPSGAVKAQVFAIVINPSLENETRPGVAYFDDIVVVEKGATGAKQVLFIPASASAHGQNGTFWTTTGWFANNVDLPVDLNAAFLRQGQDNSSALTSLTKIGTVPAGGYLEIQDVAAKIGGAGLSGGIYIEATAQGSGLPATLVTATTYTWTPNPGGSGGYGQGLPAVGVGAKSAVVIPGVYQGADYRTNIGALNTSGVTVEIDVRVLGPSGSELGSATWTLKPYEQKQISVTALGINSASGGFVTLTRLGTGGSFSAYASVVDQSTGDAVYTPGM